MRRRAEEPEEMKETEAAVGLVGGGAMLAFDWGLLGLNDCSLLRA